MNEKNKKTLSDIAGNLNEWILSADDIKPIIESSEFEEVMEFLKTTIESGGKAWIVQSDIIRYFHDKAKYGKKVIKELSRELGLSRTHCYELLKINKDIFDEDPDLRNAPTLNISHFAYVVKNMSKITDPVGMLHTAIDNGWNVSQLKRHITGTIIPNTTYTSVFYKLTQDRTIDDEVVWTENKRLTSTANILTHTNGTKYLEIKTFT